MSNYYINAKLNLTPSARYKEKMYYKVVRGASAEFLVSFDEYPYLAPAFIDDSEWYRYIEQITFLFKAQSDGATIKEYKLFKKEKKEWDSPYDVDNQIMSYCEYDKDRNCISLMVPSEDTINWELADEDLPMQYELVIKADTHDDYSQEATDSLYKSDVIIIEKQCPVVVVDSLYHEHHN